MPLQTAFLLPPIVESAQSGIAPTSPSPGQAGALSALAGHLGSSTFDMTCRNISSDFYCRVITMCHRSRRMGRGFQCAALLLWRAREGAKVPKRSFRSCLDQVGKAGEDEVTQIFHQDSLKPQEGSAKQMHPQVRGKCIENVQMRNSHECATQSTSND